MIEDLPIIQKGHDPGACFWIMPVKCHSTECFGWESVEELATDFRHGAITIHHAWLKAGAPSYHREAFSSGLTLRTLFIHAVVASLNL